MCGNGQFCDNGHSYFSVLFYYTTEEQVIALDNISMPLTKKRSCTTTEGA
jgi:peptide methionine sulfoxide reductase MsrA